MGISLKPCPFCNGKADIIRMGNHRQSMIISCEDCGCTLETGETFISDSLSWNSRADYKKEKIDAVIALLKPCDNWGDKSRIHEAIKMLENLKDDR